MEPHPALAPLAFLLGTWRGEGAGEYPTIGPFRYTEQLVFGQVGKPFLTYRQTSRRLGGDEAPLHTEVGYLRPVDPDTAELVLAQPTGVVEVHGGVVDGAGVTFRSLTVATTPTAKPVSEVERWFRRDGDELHYRLAMAAVGRPLTHHLEGRLDLVGDPSAS
ncbi:MAG: FABP family protein [Acidimicrobiales bacterium]